MVVCDVCQSQLLVSMEEGVGEDGEGDDLAVHHIRLWASGTEVAASSIQEPADVINDDKRGDENVLPFVDVGDVRNGWRT